MDYITAREVAEKWGISTRRVQVLCHQGKISGVFRFNNAWAIPNNAMKPADRRYKKGKQGKE